MEEQLKTLHMENSQIVNGELRRQLNLRFDIIENFIEHQYAVNRALSDLLMSMKEKINDTNNSRESL